MALNIKRGDVMRYTVKGIVRYTVLCIEDDSNKGVVLSSDFPQDATEGKEHHSFNWFYTIYNGAWEKIDRWLIVPMRGDVLKCTNSNGSVTVVECTKNNSTEGIVLEASDASFSKAGDTHQNWTWNTFRNWEILKDYKKGKVMQISGHEVKNITPTSAKVGCTTVTREEVEKLLEAMKEATPVFKMGKMYKSTSGNVVMCTADNSTEGVVMKPGPTANWKTGQHYNAWSFTMSPESWKEVEYYGHE